MTSLVSDFLINPVLRQARRFSEISRSTFAGDADPADQNWEEVVDSSEQSGSQVDGNVSLSPARSRPPSSSTQSSQSTRVEPIPTQSSADDDDRMLRMWNRPPAGSPIPEDDGMKVLRQRIHAIHSQDLSEDDKGRLLHETMMEGHRRSRAASQAKSSSSMTGQTGLAREQLIPLGPLERLWQTSLGEASETFVLTADDLKPTYATVRTPREQGTSEEGPEEAPMGVLGCQHYQRKVKLQCSICAKWYTCRFCHDAIENDHALIRNQTRNMLCMVCGSAQRASETCVNCGTTAARYYCNICKLWDDHPTKSIYHCNDCGICRRGRGLGKDFFHCKKCSACISISIESSHKCIERSTDCPCPICQEYMFNSPRPVVFMACGHSIHKKCYSDHMKTSYKCPVCNKSLCNMETQFRNLDQAIESQPMPEEFQNTRVKVLCNDCSARSWVPYHWIGLKCAVCSSFNTVEEGFRTVDGERPALIGTGRIGPEGGAAAGVDDSAQSATHSRPVRSRRHSSHGQELQQTIPDRLARSASPQLPNSLRESLEQLSELDEDSEDDMLDLWTRVGFRSSHEDDDDDEEDSDSVLDEFEEDEEDDDDEDEDDIRLIGHR